MSPVYRRTLGVQDTPQQETRLDAGVEQSKALQQMDKVSRMARENPTIGRYQLDSLASSYMANAAKLRDQGIIPQGVEIIGGVYVLTEPNLTAHYGRNGVEGVVKQDMSKPGVEPRTSEEIRGMSEGSRWVGADIKSFKLEVSAEGQAVFLGQGGYGQVFKGQVALKNGDVRDVAFKRFYSDSMPDEVAHGYQRCMDDLRPEVVDMPSMAMVKTSRDQKVGGKGLEAGEWVQISSLYKRGGEKEIKDFYQAPHETKISCVQGLTKIANTGYSPVIDVVAMVDRGKGGVKTVLHDIDQLVSGGRMSPQQCAGELVDSVTTLSYERDESLAGELMKICRDELPEKVKEVEAFIRDGTEPKDQNTFNLAATVAGLSAVNTDRTFETLMGKSMETANPELQQELKSEKYKTQREDRLTTELNDSHSIIWEATNMDVADKMLAATLKRYNPEIQRKY